MLEELTKYLKRKIGQKSKSKGSRGEQQVCHFLRAWTGHKFERTFGSGRDRRYQWNPSSVGDVCPSIVMYNFPLVVEVKNYAKLSGYKTFKNGKFHGGINPNGFVAQTFKHSSQEAERLNQVGRLHNIPDRFPCLFLKETGYGTEVFKGKKVSKFHVALGKEFYKPDYQGYIKKCFDENGNLLFFTFPSKDIEVFIKLPNSSLL